ncbi:sugar transporter family protein [Xylogone sp. PMI_703]|nr:sugar transporter family protein [Xylogone sp. PMI_703]
MFGLPRYFGLRGKPLGLAIAILAGLDFLLFGYDQGVMGGLLTLPSFIKTFPEIDVVNTQGLSHSQVDHRSTIQGISVASYNVGCFLGAIGTIWLGDMLGRRKMIFIGSSIMVVGAALQCSAFSLPHFIVGRIITGIGNGMNTSTVPTWQSETSKSHQRGKLVMIEGAMITGGICLSYWLDFGFSFLHSSISWRFPIAFQIVFALVMLAFILELPESPRWLILKGHEEEAMSVLSALRDLPADDEYIHSEFAAIKDTVIESSKYTFRDLFTMGPDRHFHRVLLGYVNQVFQQISGINLITYYAATIYEQQVGLSPLVSRLLAAANGTEYFIASFIAVYTIEKFGRRNLMLFGAAGMTLSMAILAIMNRYPGTATGIVSAAFLFIFNSFFAVGWLGMTWLYPAEIVPLGIRAPANALSTSANWAFNFMVVMITPVSFSSIGYKTYVIFAVINAFIIPVVYFFYPETAYRSLEEMDAIFHKTKNWFSVVSIARNEPRRYGKHGELLINYDETDEHAIHTHSMTQNKASAEGVENTDSTPRTTSEKSALA